jgi:hypothetical protein
MPPSQHNSLNYHDGSFTRLEPLELGKRCLVSVTKFVIPDRFGQLCHNAFGEWMYVIQ